MAIIAGLRALRVTVLVDGKTAHEYNDPAEDKTSVYCLPFDPAAFGPGRGYDPHVVRYIEADPGASLSFRISKQARFQHRSHHIAARISFSSQASLLQHETDGNIKAKGRKWRTTLSRFRAGPGFLDREISVHCAGRHEIEGLMEAGIEPRPIPANLWHSIADEVDYLSEEEARDRLIAYMYLEQQSRHEAALDAEEQEHAKAEPHIPELKQEPQTQQQDSRLRVKRERRARQPRIKQESRSPPPLSHETRADRAIKRERLRAARGIKREPSDSD
ncbi:hypothetical protein NEMBOFW57_003684 [Staphylotrichum longicolle]|uniref:DUF7918 domain-containing protein n=1 Tax=Staphylotrichum longicolle TaxID=669026 RepID=A0AAD4F6P8_9PEZI|nr:hypothetical protein NEMBOFW57_003684 [Staphylotrichum longicolle]